MHRRIRDEAIEKESMFWPIKLLNFFGAKAELFLRCSSVWPIHGRSLALSPALLAHSCSAMTREYALRIGVYGSSRGSDSRPSGRVGKFRAGSCGVPILSYCSGSRRFRDPETRFGLQSMTAMSGQFDFRSAWQNSDAIGSKASYNEGTETERIMYIIYINTRVISFYLSVSCWIIICILLFIYIYMYFQCYQIVCEYWIRPYSYLNKYHVQNLGRRLFLYRQYFKIWIKYTSHSVLYVKGIYRCLRID